jgi:plastocyanin
MSRGAIFSLALAATLVAAAVAVGAGAEVRIHRLHLPPPPAAAEGGGALPIDSGAPAVPAAPVVTQPAAPAPVVTNPAPPPVVPPAAPALGCTATGGGATADVTGTLVDEAITLAPATVAAGATLRFRGVNQGAETHNLSLRDSTNTKLCGTPDLAGGQADTFVVTNLPPGTYQLYCSIHPLAMRQTLTVS